MTVKYKTVITKAGAKAGCSDHPEREKVNFTAMAVGDGGGTLPTPDASQTKLVNEVWRHTLNKISQDNKNKNYVSRSWSSSGNRRFLDAGNGAL
jgi:phage-related tail fiber protein